MTLRWNPQINDYEDVPGGYATTPALTGPGSSPSRDPFTASSYTDPYAGLSEQEASSQYLGKLMKESLYNKSFHVPVGRSLARVDIPGYSMSGGNQRAWDEERYRNREILRLMMQEKRDYEEQQRNRAEFAKWQASGGEEGFNPTAQRATSFAPNAPGQQYVDPMLQQQISPEGLVQWAEQRQSTAGTQPKTVSTPVAPVNFKGGDQLELMQGKNYISPLQMLQAWNQGSQKPMPTPYEGGQGIFNVDQQALVKAHQAAFEESMLARDKGEKGTGSKREIELTSQMKSDLETALTNLKGPDKKTPLYSKPEVAQIIGDYQKNPQAVPDTVLKMLGSQWGGIPRPLPSPCGQQTPVGAGIEPSMPAATNAPRPWYETREAPPSWARSAAFASNPLLQLYGLSKQLPSMAGSLSEKEKANWRQVGANVKQLPGDIMQAANPAIEHAKSILAELLRDYYGNTGR